MTTLKPIRCSLAAAALLAVLPLATVFAVSAPFAPAALAAKLADVNFDDTLDVAGKKLVLNGLGLRKFAIFKVYVGGLYLENKEASPETILASQSPKVIKLHFLRDVGSKDIRKAWSEGFDKNCTPEGCKTMRADIEALNAFMPECKEGDVVEFGFTSEGVALSLNGTRKGEVKKAGFSREILAIFLGKNPPNEALKEGLLGAK